jgi:hypothetical protein
VFRKKKFGVSSPGPPLLRLQGTLVSNGFLPSGVAQCHMCACAYALLTFVRAMWPNHAICAYNIPGSNDMNVSN